MFALQTSPIASKRFKVDFETTMITGEKIPGTMEIEAFGKEGAEFQFFYQIGRDKSMKCRQITRMTIIS